MGDQRGTHVARAIVYRPKSTALSILNTVIEVVLLSVPTLLIFAILIWLTTSPLSLLGWVFAGTVGLTTVVSVSRSSAVHFGFARWPHPDDSVNAATLLIAYNGVLLISTLLSEVVWRVVNSWTIVLVVAVLLPVWFLKHIHLIIIALGEDK